MEYSDYDFSSYGYLSPSLGYISPSNYNYTTRTDTLFTQQIIKNIRPKELFPDPPKETPPNMIDNAIREALAQPAIDAEEERQKAEIERRLTLADQIGYNDEHEVGTVLRWTRRLGRDTDHSKSTEYKYVGFKAGDGNWYLTGQHQQRASGWKWSALIEWMLTGDNTVENLQVATAWEDII